MSKYNGQLKEFPEEVVEKMLERQVEQGNPKDVTVFEKEETTDKWRGGFDWSHTPEGRDFWRRAINLNEFDHFFEKYPKKKIEGYTLAKPEYKAAASAITGFEEDSKVWELENGLSEGSKAVKRLKEAGVLDLWFEPVYEEPVDPRFVVGAWITFSDLGVAKVTKVDGEKVHTTTWTNFDSTSFVKSSIAGRECRLATEEEIEAAQAIVVSVGGKFDVSIRGRKIYHGAEDITDSVEALLNYYDNRMIGKYEVVIEDITFAKTGCKHVETKLSDWEKVWEQYNKATKQ